MSQLRAQGNSAKNKGKTADSDAHGDPAWQILARGSGEASDLALHVDAHMQGDIE